MTKNISGIDLIEALELEELPLEEQAKMLESISGAVMTAIVAKSIPILDESAQQEFNTLLDTAEDPSQVQTFLSEKIPNFQEIVNEEVSKFKEGAVDFYRGL